MSKTVSYILTVLLCVALSLLFYFLWPLVFGGRSLSSPSVLGFLVGYPLSRLLFKPKPGIPYQSFFKHVVRDLLSSPVFSQSLLSANKYTAADTLFYVSYCFEFLCQLRSDTAAHVEEYADAFISNAFQYLIDHYSFDFTTLNTAHRDRVAAYVERVNLADTASDSLSSMAVLFRSLILCDAANDSFVLCKEAPTSEGLLSMAVYDKISLFDIQKSNATVDEFSGLIGQVCGKHLSKLRRP